MSRIPEREERLIRIEGQIEQKKLYAHFWMAQAITRNVTRRGLSRGRELTAEEKAAGETSAWVEFTDEEKIADALSIAETHIRQLEKLYEAKIAIFNDDPQALREVDMS